MAQIFSYTKVILDCDGVIFDSNPLKIKALKKALQTFPEDDVEHAVSYMKKNFGKGRIDIFTHFIRNYTSQDLHQTLPEILKNYGLECEKLYQSASFTQGFHEFVEKVSKQAELFIASGNAEDELQRAFQKRGIEHYFKGVYGSPRKKTEVLLELSKNQPKEDFVMIGDAYADYCAAENAKIAFIYLSGYSTDHERMKSLRQSRGFEMVKDLGGLIA